MRKRQKKYMDLNEMMELALLMAVKAHKGQVDKGGNPYILHPIAVSNMMQSKEEKIVAILHDIVEDTDIFLSDLSEAGFSDEIVNAIDCITRRKEEAYITYLNRVKENKISKSVKRADLKHNMDLSRIKNPTKKDFDRVKRYQYYANILEQV